MRISDWSSDVCSSDLDGRRVEGGAVGVRLYDPPPGRTGGRGGVTRRSLRRVAVGRIGHILFRHRRPCRNSIQAGGEPPHLRVAEQQPQLAAPPQGIVGGSRPFPFDPPSSKDTRVGKELVSTCKIREAPDI